MGEFSASTIMYVLFGILIAILVGLILIPALTNQVYLTSKNTTIANTTKNPTAVGLASLLPVPALMFIIAVVLISVIGGLYMLHQLD